jgi:hypothetical protein
VVVLLLLGCAGPALNEELIARQSNAMFDHFWNSEWVVSAVNLDVDPDPEFVQQAWADLQAKNRAAEELAAFGVEARGESTHPHQFTGVARRTCGQQPLQGLAR